MSELLRTMSIDATEDTTEQESVLLALRHACGSPETVPATTLAATLLPAPLANAVSFATRSTSLALRIGTAISGYGFGAAQATTLSSLVLGRALLRGTLNKSPDPARTDAESILARSLESMHQTMSRFIFWTAAGLQAAGTTASTVSQTSQLFLTILDQFLGSTDSSRAIAGIIALIRREFQNPATGIAGERVGVMDLLLGLCGLAYLQNRCRKMLEAESRRLRYEETVWDVIVLNHEEGVDTSGESIENVRKAQSHDHQDDAKPSKMEQNDGDDDHILEVQLTKQILKTLPKDANISCFVSTTMTKRITVDITGASSIPFSSFLDLEEVEGGVSSSRCVSQGNEGQGAMAKYRVVYTVSRNSVRTIPGNSLHENTSARSEPNQKNVKRSRSFNDINTQYLKTTIPIPATSTTSSSPGFLDALSSCSTLQPISALNDSRRSRSGSPKEQDFKDSTASAGMANQKRARSPLEGPRKTNKSPSNSVRALNEKIQENPDTSSIRRGDKKPGVTKNEASQRRKSHEGNMTGSKAKSNIKPAWSTSWRTPPKCDKVPSIVVDRDSPRTSRETSPASCSFKSQTSPRTPLSPMTVNTPITLAPPTNTAIFPSCKRRATSQPPLVSGTATTFKDLNPRRPNVNRTDSPSLGVCEQDSQDSKTESLNVKVSQDVSSAHTKRPNGSSMDINTLRQSGCARGMFPDFHLVRNIARYSRYASAIYGHNFLTLMGIMKDRPPASMAEEVHNDLRSFAHHTKLPHNSILLASFVDSQGGSDSTGATRSGIPLVHTVSLDGESKAVVLTCRGTLGFEDILADMMCEYDELVWQGKAYNVHKGIHASARRLLYGRDGRVLFAIKTALEQYPDYGLVLCGHSLGGSVTALLGVMLAEPSSTGTGFITSSTEHRNTVNRDSAGIRLPPGRPIHVYAYGPPATMSPSLQKATRGLITSTVHGNDLVPYLSLGVLHDFQALALAFKSDNLEAKAEVKRRVWEALRTGLANKWYSNLPKPSDEDNEQWAYVALKTLRASMVSNKLLPPGEVFKIESTMVDNENHASRVVLKYVRDVEACFRHVRFGASMLMDHSPGRYEDALGRLEWGVVG